MQKTLLLGLARVPLIYNFIFTCVYVHAWCHAEFHVEIKISTRQDVAFCMAFTQYEIYHAWYLHDMGLTTHGHSMRIITGMASHNIIMLVSV